MKRMVCPSIGLFLVILPCCVCGAASREGVLVSYLKGSADEITLHRPLRLLMQGKPEPEREATEERRAVRLYDRLPSGSYLEVGEGSVMALTFGSGKRYLLYARSRVRLGRKDLTSRSGHVQPLAPLDPLLPPVAPGSAPGRSSGALRLQSSNDGRPLPGGRPRDDRAEAELQEILKKRSREPLVREALDQAKSLL